MEMRSAAKRAALADGARYFERRADSLGYAERLACGQSIGSGLVGGRQAGDRAADEADGRMRRANRMAILCGTFHRDTGTPCWEHRLD